MKNERVYLGHIRDAINDIKSYAAVGEAAFPVAAWTVFDFFAGSGVLVVPNLLTPSAIPLMNS